MAKSGPATNGSQFFITEKATPWLDNKHSIFGEVVKGINVQDSISNVKVSPGNNKPLEDVTITAVNIIRQGMKANGYDAAKTWQKELPLLEEKRQKKAEEMRKEAELTKTLAEEKIAEAATALLPSVYSTPLPMPPPP